MRVLIVSENRCRDNMVPWPIGPACIASAAKAAGHDVRGLDLMFSADARADAVGAVGEFNPEVVGVSVRNIDNQDMASNEFYLPAAREVVRAIRGASDAHVVLGGAGFTIFPLECLDYFELGVGIVGEGEDSFVELLGALESCADLSHIPGVALAGRPFVNPAPPVDLARAVPPDRHVFGLSGYNWVPGHGPPFVANLQSRRGCELRCIYCSSPTVEGRVVRCRDANEVACELEELDRSHGIRTVVFADSHFNHPAGYAEELCARISEKRLSIRWTAGINPRWFDPDLFPMMRRAGCFAVSLGNESGSAITLEALRKEFTVDDVRRSAHAVRAAGMEMNCFLLLGGPGENRSTVEESVALMDELEPEAVRVTVGIRVFPGCELERIAAEEGVIAPGEDLLEPTFYLNDEVAPWLLEYMRAEGARRKGWFV